MGPPSASDLETPDPDPAKNSAAVPPPPLVTSVPSEKK